MKYYFVVHTDAKGRDYCLHGGYVHNWIPENAYYLNGYRSKRVAKIVMTKLIKRYEGVPTSNWRIIEKDF